MIFAGCSISHRDWYKKAGVLLRFFLMWYWQCNKDVCVCRSSVKHLHSFYWLGLLQKHRPIPILCYFGGYPISSPHPLVHVHSSSTTLKISYAMLIQIYVGEEDSEWIQSAFLLLLELDVRTWRFLAFPNRLSVRTKLSFLPSMNQSLLSSKSIVSDSSPNIINMRNVSLGTDRETLPVSACLSSLMMLMTFFFLRADALPSYIFVGTEITLVCCMLMLEEKGAVWCLFHQREM